MLLAEILGRIGDTACDGEDSRGGPWMLFPISVHGVRNELCAEWRESHHLPQRRLFQTFAVGSSKNSPLLEG